MIPSGWTLKRIIEPPVELVTLAQAKAQCRIDPDITDSDGTLTLQIKAARELAEAYTRRAFVEQTWRLTMPSFPMMGQFWGDQGIRLPIAPLIQINSINYVSWTDAGTLTPLTLWNGQGPASSINNQYYLAQDDEPPVILPPFGCFWPVCRPQAGGVAIEFVAGYPSAGSPADAGGVPARVAQAILMLVGHWNENRESVIAGPRWAALEVPYSFEQALDSLRLY